MKDIIESIIMLTSYIAVLLFVGWVFYVTGYNPWSFALLFILPFLGQSKEETQEEQK